jgi:hypothetical protein
MDADTLALELIAQAEALFGRMTSDWKYTGLGFSEAPPHLLYNPEHAGVMIMLSNRALKDDFQLVFQLAHEVCHLLYPAVSVDLSSEPHTTVLNEGISTFFSVLSVANYFGREAASDAIASLENHSPKYYSAFLNVSSLLERDPQAVRKIRSLQTMINDVTKLEVKAMLPDIADPELDILLGQFNRS